MKSKPVSKVLWFMFSFTLMIGMLPATAFAEEGTAGGVSDAAGSGAFVYILIAEGAALVVAAVAVIVVRKRKRDSHKVWRTTISKRSSRRRRNPRRSLPQWGKSKAVKIRSNRWRLP